MFLHQGFLFLRLRIWVVHFPPQTPQPDPRCRRPCLAVLYRLPSPCRAPRALFFCLSNSCCRCDSSVTHRTMLSSRDKRRADTRSVNAFFLSISTPRFGSSLGQSPRASRALSKACTCAVRCVSDICFAFAALEIFLAGTDFDVGSVAPSASALWGEEGGCIEMNRQVQHVMHDCVCNAQGDCHRTDKNTLRANGDAHQHAFLMRSHF